MLPLYGYFPGSVGLFLDQSSTQCMVNLLRVSVVPNHAAAVMCVDLTESYRCHDEICKIVCARSAYHVTGGVACLCCSSWLSSSAVVTGSVLAVAARVAASAKFWLDLCCTEAWQSTVWRACKF
jgi:hypothetical protein